MKHTYTWIKDYLDTCATAEEIAEAFTKQGLCVDTTFVLGAHLATFKVVEVLSTEQHPHADRLQVCTVNTGEGNVTVVCGATNVKKGLKTVLAKPGDVILGHLIKKRKIRGIESRGMLCSAAELKISIPSKKELENDVDKADGLLELPDNAPVGGAVIKVLGLDDVVFDIEIHSNRGDCLNAYGLARELAAGGVGTFKPLQPSCYQSAHLTENGALRASQLSSSSLFSSLNITNTSCVFFSGCVIENVKNNASPLWLKQRIEAIGGRSVSTLVDLTNYSVYDLGQPMHVFDLDKIQGDLTLGYAQDGETLNGLDGKTHILTHQDLVMRDAEKIIALSGIMGDQSAAVDRNTRNVFLEAAIFDPIKIFYTGQRLNLFSEARYRFERRIDPAMTLISLDNITKRIHQCTGGKASAPFINGQLPKHSRHIDFSLNLITSLCGITVSQKDAYALLKRLGFEIKDHIKEGKKRWHITPPSWRHDIDGVADIVEEIIRLKGYDCIPATPMPFAAPQHNQPHQQKIMQVKRALIAQGFDEVMGLSFTDEKDAQYFGAGLDIDNPISEKACQLRVSLLPYLLKSAQKAQAMSLSYGALFEVGYTFSGPEWKDQHLYVSGIVFGQPPRHWEKKNALLTADFFSMKSVVVRLLDDMKISQYRWQKPCEDRSVVYPIGHPARCVILPDINATCGVLHPTTAHAYDLKGDIGFFTLSLSALFKIRTQKKVLRIQTYPPLQRDFAFIADESVPGGEILEAAINAVPHLTQVGDIFDVYNGENLPQGQKSVGISLTFSNPEKTFTETEIEQLCKKVEKNVYKKTGSVLRQ